jgi:hypothetical protein
MLKQLAILLVFSIGCDKKPPAPAADPAPTPKAAEPSPAVTAKPAATVPFLRLENETVKEWSKREIRVAVGSAYTRSMQANEGTSMTLAIATRERAVIEIDGKTATADAAGKAKVEVDFGSAVERALATARIEGGKLQLPTVKLPVSVRTPDGGELTTTIGFDGTRALRMWLQSGKHVLRGEPAVARPHKSAFLLLGIEERILGTPATFSDVDLLAIQKWVSREKRCGPYVNAKGGNETFVNLSLLDVMIQVSDRRTGKEIATKTFKADAACPRTIKASSSGETAVVDDDAITRWVASFVTA